jgi:hypothetical protein
LTACLVATGCTGAADETASAQQADTVPGRAADAHERKVWAADLEARRENITSLFGLSYFKMTKRINFGPDGATEPWTQGDDLFCQLRLRSGPVAEGRALLEGNEYGIDSTAAAIRGSSEVWPGRTTQADLFLRRIGDAEELRFNLRNGKTQGIPGYEAQQGTPADFDVVCFGAKKKMTVESVAKVLSPILFDSD